MNMLFMIFAPEQSYQLDYVTCGYKEGVTGFSAKLLLSVRSWREKLRRCFIRILRWSGVGGWEQGEQLCDAGDTYF
jgi:hypothetical protein